MTKAENDEVMAMSQAYRESVKGSEATIHRLAEQLKAFEPQPIATAPKVEFPPILTDDGICVWNEMWNAWVMCSPRGGTLEDSMTENSNAYPTMWIPLPAWISAN